MLGGIVWVVETFIKVRNSDVEKSPDGKEYKGLLRNQMCLDIARDRENAVFVLKATERLPIRSWMLSPPI